MTNCGLIQEGSKNTKKALTWVKDKSRPAKNINENPAKSCPHISITHLASVFHASFYFQWSVEMHPPIAQENKIATYSYEFLGHFFSAPNTFFSTFDRNRQMCYSSCRNTLLEKHLIIGYSLRNVSLLISAFCAKLFRQNHNNILLEGQLIL